jgi:hypothetical protein
MVVGSDKLKMNSAKNDGQNGRAETAQVRFLSLARAKAARTGDYPECFGAGFSAPSKPVCVFR